MVWKVSSVIFLKKDQGVKGDPGNYRPISLLSNLSKLLESFFVGKLESEVEEKRLLSRNQFGFRKGRSTVHAIATLIDMIQDCRSQGQTAAVVFIDLKKAFDSVDHRVLVEKMRGKGISRQVVDFFTELLQGRSFVSSVVLRQIKRVGELVTAPRHLINSGVLQGSISGPLLFSLLIDDVLRAVGCTVAYADDLALVQGREDVHDLMVRTNHKYSELQRVVESLRLTINVAKTKVMLFRDSLNQMATSNREFVHNFSVFGLGSVDQRGDVVLGKKLEVVTSFKYLGVHLDKFLKFDLQVEKMTQTTNRAFRSLNGVLRLSGLPARRKVWVYKTCIRPFMTYACPVWILLTPFLMGKLLKAEYHILRALFGVYRRSNGHYVSYRSRLIKAQIPGIDYHLIRVTRRHLMRLDGCEWSRVDQQNPNWLREIHFIRRRCFTVWSTMFIDSMGLLQDPQFRNIFYSLNRSGLARRFNLEEALDPSTRTRRIREPTVLDTRASELETLWRSWAVPCRYSV